MRRSSVRKTITRTLVAGVCVLGLTGTMPAVAEEADRPDMVLRPVATNVFSLSVRADGEPTRHASLSCAPPSGSHPKPRKSCEQLDAARGEVSEIPATGDMCTAEFDPVTVSASGVWRGQRREYQQEFPNLCSAVRDTGGALFDF
ncbi:MAG: SSI family serine proteinase inhibitor [Micromonosporaceae bacterium]